ncbi:hypothetical protein [Pectobacterium zantedeschiae]|nr:hypothetical protein [Pectobacterium zantedeschiae]
MKHANDFFIYAGATFAACSLIMNTTNNPMDFFNSTMKNLIGYLITTALATSTVIKLLITYDEYKNS